jgi:23S rRNA pseudouridine1911/1915/1917 synthase
MDIAADSSRPRAQRKHVVAARRHTSVIDFLRPPPMLAAVSESFAYSISKADAKGRLDVFLCSQLPQLSRSRLQQLIHDGHITLNAATPKPGAKLRAGDEIRVTIPPPVETATLAEDIPIEILHEDADLLVLNKPPGLVVHPAAGNPRGTLVNALLHHCGALSTIGGEHRPGIVHRLDKETSGCMVVAKNDAAHQSLADQFAGRGVRKIYLALVAGHLRHKRGDIEINVARHPIHRQKMSVSKTGRGREAKTSYRVVRELPGASLVECTLHTGRTHQIRVHMKHLGHPVLGDALYGSRGTFSRQMLHAWKLGFTHPRTGKPVDFESPLPEDFRGLLEPESP